MGSTVEAEGTRVDIRQAECAHSRCQTSNQVLNAPVMEEAREKRQDGEHRDQDALARSMADPGTIHVMDLDQICQADSRDYPCRISHHNAPHFARQHIRHPGAGTRKRFVVEGLNTFSPNVNRVQT
jgi:hypothetical protein